MKKEKKLRAAVQKGLAAIQRLVLKQLRKEARESAKGLLTNAKAISDVPNDPELWDKAEGQFFNEVGGQTDDLLLEGASQAQRLGLAIDFELVNQQVLDYAGVYKNDWWNRLQTTTQNGMRTAIQTHIETGAPLGQLEKNLEPLFGKTRAEVIASTETTRMFAEGNIEAYRSAGVEMVQFQTVRDARVDPDCDAAGEGGAEGDGKYPINSAPMPPLHPRCRCLTDNQLFVYTAKGKVRFKDLKIGDLALTHKGRFRPITEILHNGEDTRRKVKLFVRQKEKFWGKYAEKKLPVTDDHPVLTPEGWKEVRDLLPGDTVYLAGHLCEVCKSQMAFVYQRTCSEGCAGQLRARGLWDNPKSKAVEEIRRTNFLSYFGMVEAEVVRIENTHLSPRASKVTYNLEVAEDHSFVAAGFVVHNCWIAPVTGEGDVLKDAKEKTPSQDDS